MKRAARTGRAVRLATVKVKNASGRALFFASSGMKGLNASRATSTGRPS